MIDEFDPNLHEWVMRQQHYIPYSSDGMTHFLTSDSRGLTGAKCSMPNARVSLNWSLVNCENCRRAANE